jgi:cobalamin biosynthesis Mg chelatase CobN
MESAMDENDSDRKPSEPRSISEDWLAVIIGLVLVGLVWLGVIAHMPWPLIGG